MVSVPETDVSWVTGQSEDQNQSDKCSQDNPDGKAKADVIDVVGCQSQDISNPVRCRRRIQDGSRYSTLCG